MKEHITVCGKDFEIVRSSRRKRIAMGIDPSGRWFIGVPAHYTAESVLKALAQHKETAKLVELLEKKAVETPPAKEYNEGEYLFFRGEKYPLRWAFEAGSPPVELRNGAFCVSAERKGSEDQAFEMWYSKQLYHLLREVLPGWTRSIGVAPKKIAIKRVKTIWGSCSAKGSITFSARLALVPPPLLEYVVVHELVHLKHMNHSNDFWQEVVTHVPDYKKRREELKKDGALYKWW